MALFFHGVQSVASVMDPLFIRYDTISYNLVKAFLLLVVK